MADEQLVADSAGVGAAGATLSTDAPSGSASASVNPTPASTTSHTLSLRSADSRALVGVELPVYGSDMNKVLETVGGLRSLQQAHETKSQFLPVKLRPTEPSCKPLFADLTKTQMILLRVKRSRPKRKRAAQEKSNGSTATAADGSKLTAEVVGLVKEKYVCEGMADFQYLTASSFYPTPVPSDDAVAATEEEEPSVVNNAIDAGPLSKPSTRQLELQASLRPYLSVEAETQLELIPEVFSKVDLPLKYEFRQRSGYLPTAAAKKPSSTMSYLNFHDDIPAPAGPKPEPPVARRRSVGIDDDGVDAHVLDILQNKLERKPVWLRSKLFDGLDALERRAARRLLRKLCYVFVDGPWRGSWVRMGYDPRKPEVVETAARYQVVELRNNRELVHSKVTHANRKRTKKYVAYHTTNSNGESVHKAPRIVKVTQTSALENAQAVKRRRKERFTRGETRRSYLVEPAPSGASVGPTPRGSPESSAVNSGNDSESDNDLQDASDDEGSVIAGSSSTVHTMTGGSEKVYEIFGVQLTSANVLFQLDEIDDEEVREWIAQFTKVSTPTLLGGWFPTQMFLPLREIIRLRIAALVGRSKAELDTRRKRLDVLKKQALSDYADELAGVSRASTSGQSKATDGDDAAAADADNAAAAEDEDLAFERSLILERNSESKLPAADGAETAEEDAEEDIESQEEDEENASTGRSRVTFQDGQEDDDDEDEAIEADTTPNKPQDASETKRDSPSKKGSEADYTF